MSDVIANREPNMKALIQTAEKLNSLRLAAQPVESQQPERDELVRWSRGGSTRELWDAVNTVLEQHRPVGLEAAIRHAAESGEECHRSSGDVQAGWGYAAIHDVARLSDDGFTSHVWEIAKPEVEALIAADNAHRAGAYAAARTEIVQGRVVEPVNVPADDAGGDQGAKRIRVIPPAREVSILAATWALSRHAKRLRDRASGWWEDGRRDLAGRNAARKRELYAIKGQCLAHLLAEGRVQPAGHHRFDGGLWAEILAGEGYRFHRPCPPPEPIPDVEDLGKLEAKPRKTGEPRLRDALLTATRFLAGRPRAEVYEWPPPVRLRWSHWYKDDDEWDDDESLIPEQPVPSEV
jgi:hypothetical protein